MIYIQGGGGSGGGILALTDKLVYGRKSVDEVNADPNIIPAVIEYEIGGFQSASNFTLLYGDTILLDSYSSGSGSYHMHSRTTGYIYVQSSTQEPYIKKQLTCTDFKTMFKKLDIIAWYYVNPNTIPEKEHFEDTNRFDIFKNGIIAPGMSIKIYQNATSLLNTYTGVVPTGIIEIKGSYTCMDFPYNVPNKIVYIKWQFADKQANNFSAYPPLKNDSRYLESSKYTAHQDVANVKSWDGEPAVSLIKRPMISAIESFRRINMWNPYMNTIEVLEIWAKDKDAPVYGDDPYGGQTPPWLMQYNKHVIYANGKWNNELAPITAQNLITWNQTNFAMTKNSYINCDFAKLVSSGKKRITVKAKITCNNDRANLLMYGNDFTTMPITRSTKEYPNMIFSNVYDATVGPANGTTIIQLTAYYGTSGVGAEIYEIIMEDIL